MTAVPIPTPFVEELGEEYGPVPQPEVVEMTDAMGWRVFELASCN